MANTLKSWNKRVKSPIEKIKINYDKKKTLISLVLGDCLKLKGFQSKLNQRDRKCRGATVQFELKWLPKFINKRIDVVMIMYKCLIFDALNK